MNMTRTPSASLLAAALGVTLAVPTASLAGVQYWDNPAF